MQQALLEELQCPVCMDTLDDPVLLSCAHSICRECASKQISFQQAAASPVKRAEAAPGATPFRCPLCKATTLIPDGVDSLKRNHHLRNVVEQLLKHGEPSAAVVPVCGRCEQEPAVSGCKSCGVLYCLSCREEVHIGAFARHVLTDVDTFQQSAQRELQVCEEHDEALKLYCPQCMQMVCTVCGIFGKHKSHNCKPLAEAGDCLPPMEQLEAALQAAASEATRLQAVLEKAKACVEKDGRDSVAKCKRMFIAFLRSVEDHTQQRLKQVEEQQASMGALQKNVSDLLAKLPRARTEFPERLQLHCLTVALASSLQQLEVSVPPLLQLDEPDKGKGKGKGKTSTTGGISLPTLPALSAGQKHRCQPLAYGPAVAAPSPAVTFPLRRASRCRLAFPEYVDYTSFSNSNESDSEADFL